MTDIIHLPSTDMQCVRLTWKHFEFTVELLSAFTASVSVSYVARTVLHGNLDYGAGSL